MTTHLWHRSLYRGLMVGMLFFVLSGCSGSTSKSSPTNPQGGIDATGTWNLTYTIQTTSCDYGGQPGDVNNMTITLVQDGNQLTSPEYPGSSGTINTSSGQFILTSNALIFDVTLEGVTDGTTSSGIYTLKTVRLDSGADCEIMYDFTGTKISSNTKR